LLQWYTFGMWEIIMTINSVLLSLAGVFLIYALGAWIILGAGKEFLLALLLFIFLFITQIVIAAINMA
jgi:hypothetical protein